MKKISCCKIYGIIGYPVEHSLSPCMHNTAFSRLKINAIYVPFCVRKDKLKETISLLKKIGVAGFNVTIPFKSECMRYLDRVEFTAKVIGAVNTVVIKNKRFIGYNTDCTGFIKSLKTDLKIAPKGKAVFLLGAGGAARAVAFGLAKEGACRIYIYDIIEARAKELALNINRHFTKCKAGSTGKTHIEEDIKKCQLLVNCTPLGMKKKDPLPIRQDLLHKKLKLYDIVYTPLQTKLVKVAKEKGIKAVGGLGMLVYQGAYAFWLWTKKRPPIQAMRKTLLNSLKI